MSFCLKKFLHWWLSRDHVVHIKSLELWPLLHENTFLQNHRPIVVTIERIAKNGAETIPYITMFKQNVATGWSGVDLHSILYTLHIVYGMADNLVWSLFVDTSWLYLQSTYNCWTHQQVVLERFPWRHRTRCVKHRCLVDVDDSFMMWEVINFDVLVLLKNRPSWTYSMNLTYCSCNSQSCWKWCSSFRQLSALVLESPRTLRFSRKGNTTLNFPSSDLLYSFLKIFSHSASSLENNLVFDTSSTCQNLSSCD